MKEYFLIAHLSDMHFSKINEKNPVYDSVKNIIPKFAPDFIVVTGDVADNMKPEINPDDFELSLYMAEKFLLQLCKDCKIEPIERLFIVPGNHDYRYGGNLSRDTYPNLFKKILGLYFQTRHTNIEGLNLIVFCIDSNSEKHKINFAEGLITKEEFNRLERDINLLKGKMGEHNYNETLKIALLHHHPMPIFRSEYSRNIFDSFLCLQNSATFIREVIRNKIRIVLHGHKHHRGVSKASFPIEQRMNEFVCFVSAGSIGKATNEAEYSFNIVKYYSDGRIFVDHLVQRGTGGFERESKNPYVLLDIDDARKYRYEQFSKRASFIVERLLCIDEIEEFSGDWKIYQYTEGLRKNSSLTQAIPQTIKSSGGLYTKKPQYKIISPSGQTAAWEDTGDIKNGIRKGNIKFDFKLGNTPIIFSIVEEVPNAISFTQEERKSALSSISFNESESTERVDEENLYMCFKEQLPKQFDWEIRFPPTFFPVNPRIRVCNESGKIEYSEQDYCRKNFHYSKTTNTATLSIGYPIWNFKYNVIWNIQSEEELFEKQLSDLDKHHIQKIKRYFLQLSPNDSNEGIIGNWLKELHHGLIKFEDLYFNKKHEDMPMELSLSIFDERIQTLRHVAFFCPHCSDIKNASIWNFTTQIGHPVSGLVYKRKQFHITLAQSRQGTEFANYLRKPSCKNKKNNKIQSFAATPLFFPMNSNYVIGVFELATCSDSDFIYRWNEGTKGDREDRHKMIGNLFNNKFSNFCENIILT